MVWCASVLIGGGGGGGGGGVTRAVLLSLVVFDGQGSAQGEQLNPQLLRDPEHQQHPQSLEGLAARVPERRGRTLTLPDRKPCTGQETMYSTGNHV